MSHSFHENSSRSLEVDRLNSSLNEQEPLQIERNSEQEALDIHISRSNSLPSYLDQSARKRISQYIQTRIMEMELDFNSAKMILLSLDDSQFREDEENSLLQLVLNQLIELDVELLPVTNYPQGQHIPLRRSMSFARITQRVKQYFVNQPHQLEEEDKEQLDHHQGLLNNRIKCFICDDQYDGAFFQKMEACEHRFCRQCVIDYLTNKINTSDVININCPSDGCLISLSDAFIQEFVGEENMRKLKKYRLIKELAGDNSVRWCTRAGCDNFIRRKGKEKNLVCICGQEVCFRCGASAHPATDCDLAQEKNYKQALKKFGIQKCPKCASDIEKNAGCNHMTCQHCRHQFCWLCLAPYTSKHYAFYNIFGCPGNCRNLHTLLELQFSDIKPFRCPCLMRGLFVTASITLGPPLAVLAIGLAIALAGLLLALAAIAIILGGPLILYFQCNYSHYRSLSCIEKFFFTIFLLIVSFALSPISAAVLVLGVAGGLLFGIFYGLFILCKLCLFCRI